MMSDHDTQVRITDIAAKQFHWGTLLSTSATGPLINRKYVGYSTIEAKRIFRDYVNAGGR